ncbi:hypothetical protein [Allobranchiibius sp. GilTou73]|uniref:hypothetical protein n=1 Tax=Allobranchiibius sp. GilTou73 TaxID=2904523 RepID=UPI001F3C074E|nr:hypothetical protein [Allobranchiibius sp. GilTou73]UIJ35426.1 hypothetical protein LVQ62_03275 [Allobranchiibius sp. GilTou73]
MTTRTDLPYLRRRVRPTAPAAAPAASTPSEASTVPTPAPAGTAVADFLSGRSVRPGRERPAPQPALTPSLDLDAPTASTPSTPTPAASSISLDLGGDQPAAPTPTSTSSTSLDLGGDEPAAPDTTAPRRSVAPLGRHTREQPYDLRLPTITEHERRVLSAADRVVHLTRMQSAVGRLRIEPALGAGEHLDLGCVLETSDRQESIVLGTLNRQGPDPRRPMVRCGGQGVEIDLRRILSLSRLLVVAVAPRLPGGTLVVTTYGGSRMEIPLPVRATLGAQALLTAYVVQGRLVLRAELDPFSGTLQQVCGAYGYTDLTWRDPATPLV